MDGAKPAQSKLSKMRQKLQLKSGVDEASTQQELEVPAEKPNGSPSHQAQDEDEGMTGVSRDAAESLAESVVAKKKSEAERFEVMDSLRKKGNKGLMDDARPIIGSIKHLWGLNYKDSKIDIERWQTEHIVTPMQKTNFDCGYFMLKFIELWTGRLMPAINPADMPIIRKILLQKWLEWVDNKIDWQELLF